MAVTRWEYMAHDCDFGHVAPSGSKVPVIRSAAIEQLAETFNRLGEEGWEAFDVINMSAFGAAPFPVLLFKRPKPQPT